MVDIIIIAIVVVLMLLIVKKIYINTKAGQCGSCPHCKPNTVELKIKGKK